MANDIVQSIITLLKNKRLLKITEIADNLKKNHNTIKRYLEALINLRLVEIQKEKSRNLYKLNKQRYLKAEKFVQKS
jgi:DNA-binding IclR family transcriptional regulator